jgi:hypothetical protein
MTIGEMLKQALHYARTCKSLWLFGFVVGVTSGGSSGGSGGQDGGVSIGAGGVAIGSGGGGLPFGVSPATMGAIVVAIVLTAIVGAVMRLVSEGALIEGVARTRRGGAMTMRDAFRAGWAHAGVVLQILVIYVIGTIGTFALVGVPCFLAIRAFGVVAGIPVVVVAVIVGVPMLLTLYLVQAFALRIAVLENRRASDAIGKARLFLHGRLMHGLKLIVAMFVGTMAIAIIGIVALVPVALVLRASALLSGFSVIVIAVRW